MDIQELNQKTRLTSAAFGQGFTKSNILHYLKGLKHITTLIQATNHTKGPSTAHTRRKLGGIAKTTKGVQEDNVKD